MYRLSDAKREALRLYQLDYALANKARKRATMRAQRAKKKAEREVQHAD